MEILREIPDQDVIETPLRGTALLGCAMLNKGTAFSPQEREELGLLGLVPPIVSDINMQLRRTYANYSAQTSELERYIYLRSLQDRNETLFYRLLREHLVDMLPVIYTPGVALGCLQFSRMYRKPRGVYIPFPHRARIETILNNRPYADVDIIVVTDGERILGLGDQGAGGMGIPIGKLSLYTVCGGINPTRTLPILLDVGTNNPEALADPLYVGWRHERIRGAEYDGFIDDFVAAVRRTLPRAILQWEDFGNEQAKRILERYRDQLCTFNDDIQGTAAVALAALLGALRVTGGRLTEQRVVFVGAGSAGLGIAEQIARAMMTEGLGDADARARCWILDSKGLIHAGRADLPAAKARWAKEVERSFDQRIDLLEVVRRVRPTVLIGISGRPNAFSEPVVREMGRHVDRPVIFPLSNPTSLAEARPTDLLEWTEGRAIIATGSPFAPVEFCGRKILIPQCNNCYIFPGVGLGAVAAQAARITDGMMLAASSALCNCAAEHGDLLPALEKICEVSSCIAAAVARQAQADGVAPPTTPAEIDEHIRRIWWDPYYRTIRPAGLIP